MGLTRNADLFRTLVGRGVGLVFCDLRFLRSASRSPGPKQRGVLAPRGREWQNDRCAVASPIAAR